MHAILRWEKKNVLMKKWCEAGLCEPQSHACPIGSGSRELGSRA